MKKFIIPSIFAFGLLFSCNNDDDSSIKSESIVGTWSFVKNQIQFSKDNQIKDEENDNNGCQVKDKYTFSKENKYIHLSHEYYNNQCNEFTEEATYKVEGKKLYMDWGNNDIYEAEIVKLTKNELIFKSDYGEDLDGDGINEIEILHLKR